MTTKEISIQAVYVNDKPIVAVIGDREPQMYKVTPFKRSDYEEFLNEFTREGKEIK